MERIDDLILGGLKIIQDPDEFCFSIDAILLAHFPTLKKGIKVIDLGTGTGVIPLVLTAREKNLEKIIGLEIQSQMVELAKKSVRLNNLEEKIEIVQGDIRDVWKNFQYKFDLVITNPPYMSLGKGKINPKQSVAIARHEILVSLEEVINEYEALRNAVAAARSGASTDAVQLTAPATPENLLRALGTLG